jgi:hypothetical protein
MEQIKKGIFIDFDGVISKSSVRITIDFLHSFFNKREPISYNFVENYVKVVSCFPVEDSVKLLFKSLGMERYLKSFYKEFKLKVNIKNQGLRFLLKIIKYTRIY